MPFGLNIAPRVFTKLGERIVQELRTQGVMLVAYLDDWLIWATSVEECRKSTAKVINFMEILGFQINKEKSLLVPASHFQWLGIHNTQVISSTQEDQGDSSGYETVPQEQKGVSVYPRENPRFTTVRFSKRRPITNQIERHQSKLEKESQQQAQRQDLNNSTYSDREALSMDETPESSQVSTTAIPTAVSNHPQNGCITEQLGGYSQYKKVQGTWLSMFRQFHINIPEAMAVFLTLKRPALARNSHVRIVSESLVVVHCINRGDSKASKLNHVFIAIFSLATKNHWYLSATHLVGVRNVIADTLSRTTPLESEWSLDRKLFRWICKQIPDLQVDLLATEANHKLPCYVAPNPDPLAYATDAMSIDWNNWQKIYLFPPVNLLMKVLHKAKIFHWTSNISGTTTGPKSNWFPLLLELKLQPRRIPRPELTQTVQTHCVSFLKNSECPNFMDFMKFAAQKDASIDPLNILFIGSDKRESTFRQYASAFKN
ncbi:uncharacterized protein LOC135212216 [Macrobrachium nipponense]|uniref:uncharacterized protein LOC135212216 n=1 Tax=Macrobrachium nipponense TaxID=159736 RepID=UPI0030C8CE0D